MNPSHLNLGNGATNNNNGFRRIYSIEVPSAGTISFDSLMNLSSDQYIENNTENQTWDPLPILIRMTDIVLIVTAVIFVIALGIVAAIVVIAIIKVHFPKDNVDLDWTDIWTFWQLYTKGSQSYLQDGLANGHSVLVLLEADVKHKSLFDN